MTEPEMIRVQGRRLSGADLQELQGLIDSHPDWSRHRVACHLCEQWAWRTATGQRKTFAARSLLLRLAGRYGLRLPALRWAHRSPYPWGVRPPGAWEAEVGEAGKPVEGPLSSLQPLRWQLAPYGSRERAPALAYLRRYHYLGCERPVGSHLLYLVADVQGREVAVHLVGAAAWQCAARDRFIGWSAPARRAHLSRVANHSRFLILPWVRVPHLASHLLGQLVRRLPGDWRAQHGQSLELLESFVEVGRFAGTAYRAANWRLVGQTSGRSRQEKAHRAVVPPKAIWVYPLQRQFRRRLSQV